MKRLLLTLLLIAVFGAGLVLSYHNSHAVRFDYLAGAVELPLMGLLVAAFVVGLLVSGLLNLAAHWSLRREARRLGKQLTAAQAELGTLRQLPLPDAAAADSKDA